MAVGGKLWAVGHENNTGGARTDDTGIKNEDAGLKNAGLKTQVTKKAVISLKIQSRCVKARKPLSSPDGKGEWVLSRSLAPGITVGLS